MKRPTTTALFAAATAACAWAGVATASLEIYEPFDYTTTGFTNADGAFFG